MKKILIIAVALMTAACFAGPGHHGGGPGGRGHHGGGRGPAPAMHHGGGHHRAPTVRHGGRGPVVHHGHHGGYRPIVHHTPPPRHHYYNSGSYYSYYDSYYYNDVGYYRASIPPLVSVTIPTPSPVRIWVEGYFLPSGVWVPGHYEFRYCR